jgi:hypothetical protein
LDAEGVVEKESEPPRRLTDVDPPEASADEGTARHASEAVTMPIVRILDVISTP